MVIMIQFNKYYDIFDSILNIIIINAIYMYVYLLLTSSYNI